MPRWYWWVAGVIGARAVWENVSPEAAGALAVVLLLGYWGYRLGTAPSVGETRARAAWRELRGIVLEVSDAVLGWTLILLLLLAIAGLIATWPPGWLLITIVVVLVVAVPLVLIASVLGVSNVVDRIRSRRWTAIRQHLEPVLAAWERHALSTEPTDHAVVERVIGGVYARKRGLKPPAVRWASSPPEFTRMLEAVEERPRLHKPPPSWVSVLAWSTSFVTWHSIWAVAADDGDADGLPSAEIEAALAAAAGADGLDLLVEHTSCFAFRTGVAVVLERPTEIHVDDAALHNPTGPAVRFPGGWTGWAIEGVPVPAEAIEHPDRFDPHLALTHPNVEVRRVLLDHLGWHRVVSSSGLTPRAQDEHGRLWQLPVPDDDPVLLLEVENATAEADGTHRRYFLRVPPDMRSPREATAWTFGLSELEYAPDAES